MSDSDFSMQGRSLPADRTATVAFSGYRDFHLPSLRNDEIVRVLTSRLMRLIPVLYREGYTEYLCGMAEGFDLIAGQAVLQVRERIPDLRLTAILPYEGLVAASRNEAFRAACAEVLGKADSVYTIGKYRTRECFRQRNDLMIAHCSTLVCFYDGRMRCGTEYNYRKAEANGLRIINLCAKSTALEYCNEVDPEIIRTIMP